MLIQFGPFDRHGEQLHVHNDNVKTSTKTEMESTDPTTKTKILDLTMDNFWDIIFP